MIREIIQRIAGSSTRGYSIIATVVCTELLVVTMKHSHEAAMDF